MWRWVIRSFCNDKINVHSIGICGHTLNLDAITRGNLTYPNAPQLLYPPNVNCVWKLWNPQNKMFILNFYSFDVENDPYCDFDYVELAEQAQDGHIVRQRRHCGQTPFKLNSTSSSITIRMFSDSSSEGRGFKMTYSTQTAGKHLSSVKVKYIQHTL